MKLPKFFQNRIFAIRETHTRHAAAAAAAAAAVSEVTAASAAVCVEDSTAMSDKGKKVDCTSSDKQH